MRFKTYWVDSHKRQWKNAICSNTGGPRDYHTTWNKSEKERQIPYDITNMCSLKYDTNELIYETETDSNIEVRLVVAKGKGGGGRTDWEFGVRCNLLQPITYRCKILHIGCKHIYIYTYIYINIYYIYRCKLLYSRKELVIHSSYIFCYTAEINTTL